MLHVLYLCHSFEDQLAALVSSQGVDAMGELRGARESDDTRTLFAPDRLALRTLESLDEHGVPDLWVLTSPEGEVELCLTGRNEVVVFVYTSLENLYVSCGLCQPWQSISRAELAEVVDAIDAAVVFAVDVWHPDGVRYPQPDARDMDPAEPASHAQPIAEVWIPALPVARGAKNVRLELFADPPEPPTLLAYSSLEELRRCCGPHQAAVWVYPENLDEAASQAGVSGVRFDVELADELRAAQPAVDWTLQSHFD